MARNQMMVVKITVDVIMWSFMVTQKNKNIFVITGEKSFCIPRFFGWKSWVIIIVNWNIFWSVKYKTDHDSLRSCLCRLPSFGKKLRMQLIIAASGQPWLTTSNPWTIAAIKKMNCAHEFKSKRKTATTLWRINYCNMEIPKKVWNVLSVGGCSTFLGSVSNRSDVKKKLGFTKTPPSVMELK